jgi:hypothetical protein
MFVATKVNIAIKKEVSDVLDEALIATACTDDGAVRGQGRVDDKGPNWSRQQVKLREKILQGVQSHIQLFCGKNGPGWSDWQISRMI